VLFRDDRVPLLDPATNIRPPMEPPIIELADRLHALHKLRELLELRPLIMAFR
jgi:hypothetical protein